MLNPCDWKCPDREENCHGTCSKFIEYRKFLDSKKGDNLYEQYLCEKGGAIWRMRRNRK